MKQYLKEFAFVDSQNLNLSIKDQGWELDFNPFRHPLGFSVIPAQAGIQTKITSYEQ